MILDEHKSNEPPKPRRRRLRALVVVMGVLVLALAGLLAYTRTDTFHAWVHRKVVAALEEVTGGRVELGQLNWRLRDLNFEASGLIIHGLEAPDQEPYVRADRIVVDAKVLSWIGRQVGLKSVIIERPRVHLIVYPDGHTNQPAPRAAQASAGGSPTQPLFDVKLDHAEVRNGVLLVNDRAMPLNFAADDVQATMSYVRGAQRYDGEVKVGSVRVEYKNFKPFLAEAAAQFKLFPNHVQVQGLRIASGASRVEGWGEVVDFANPRADLTYSAVVDLAQAGEIMHEPELRRGAMFLDGTGQYTAKNYGTTGKLTLKNVEYRDPSLIIAGLDAGAEYSADKDNFVLPHVFARVLGGVVTGSAEVKNWGSAPSAPGQQTPARLPEQVGTIHAKIQGMPVSRLAVAASSRALPLDRLHAVGTVNGTLEATWRGAPSHMRVQFAANAAPPPVTNANELPVTGVARGVYLTSGQTLELQQLDLSARSVQVKATGTMSRNSSLQFAVTVGDVRDVSPLLTAWSPQQELPAGFEGQGTFTGTLSGQLLKSPTLAGHLAMSDVQVPLPFRLPVPAATVMKPVTKLAPQPPLNARLARFDSLAADVQYSPSQLVIRHGIARRGGEQLTLSATIGFADGKFLETNPIQAKAAAKNFQIADLMVLGGYNVPITGMVSGDLDIYGTQDDPRGTAQFVITGGTLYGQAVQSARANVTFLNGEAVFSDVQIAQSAARVTGNATYNLKTTAFRFDLAGKNIQIADFPKFQGARMRSMGALSFEALGSGTREAPVVDANLHLRDLVMNGERLGNLEGTAKTTGSVMRIRARSDFQAADVEVDGTITMRGDFPADLSLKISRLDIDPFLHMFVKARISGHSSIGGNVRLTGPLRQPKLLTVDGDLDQFSAEIENVKIQNDGPLRFTVKDRVLYLEQLKLAGTDTTLTADGSVALSGSRALDLRAGGRVNMVLLQTLNPDLHTSGVVDFDMRARGTFTRPTLFGNVKISNGTVTNINFPNGISNLNGTLVFNQDRFQIRELTGTTGGGNVTFGGFVSYGAALSFNLTANLKNVRLRYPQGMSETMDADLRLTGTRDNSTLSGDVLINRFSVNQQFDLAVAIAASKAPPTPPDPTSMLNNVRLNIKVTSAPDLQVATSLAKLTGDVTLNLRGTATRPAILGRINITEGQVSFNGTTYQLDRGDISFSNPVKIEPVVDIAATTRVRDYDVTLGFHGPIDRLGTTYRSDPPLPTADIISLLAFGKTREESEMASAAQPTFSESASNAILGQALNAAVGSRVQRLFGVSRVKIAPELGGAETDPNAKVTIEQQVSKNFTVTYITDLSRSNQQSIQVEYNYSRNLSVIGSRDQYGIVSFDVRIRQRKK